MLLLAAGANPYLKDNVRELFLDFLVTGKGISKSFPVIENYPVVNKLRMVCYSSIKEEDSMT